MHRGGSFTFSFNVSPAYPHDPPKVKCKTKVRIIALCTDRTSGAQVSSCIRTHKMLLCV